MLTRAVPSMFHRRLLLLGAASMVGLAVVAGQAARLTILKNSELRDRAEAKLVARHWTPTTRGKILDRKGRILAEDVPSYDVVLTFPVINGEWAARRAREQAPRKFRGAWADWSPAQRDDAVRRLTAVYDQHQSEAWDRLSRMLGTTPAELKVRRTEVVSRVQRRYDSVVAMRRNRELNRIDERGDPPTEEELRAIERRSGEPIWEQSATHVIASRIADAVARDLDRYAGVEIDLVVASDDGGEPVTDRVEVIPGLRIVNAGDRIYPQDSMEVEVDRATLPGPLKRDGSVTIDVTGVGIHVIGWMREGAQDEDITRRKTALQGSPDLRQRALTSEGRDRGSYEVEVLERVGSGGAEASMESILRGLRGEKMRKLDTGETSQLPATSGRDVTVTLDISLQARVQAAMTPELGLAMVQPWNQSPRTVMGGDGQPKANPAYRDLGTPLNGAAVVLDIDSGEVLAMVSTPTFSRSQLGIESSPIFDLAQGGAFINRAIGRPYPPGSVAKALILNGAAQRGVYKVGDTIECNGHLFPNQPNAFRCWIFKMTQNTDRLTHTGQLGHGLRGAEGLMVSCNVFFFTLGQRLGLEGVDATYREFGVGTPFQLGIGPEFSGTVGRPERLGKMTIQDAIQMGIGQGPVAWTPMHAANAYATLARMGVSVPPKVIRSPAYREPGEPKRLGLNQEAAAEALEGLGLSVNSELGSGHHLVINGSRELVFPYGTDHLWIWGKTGTAAGSDTIDPDGRDGPTPPEVVAGDHSWFTVLVGPASERRPRYAISVLMEYAGSGGKVSGPICNQIIHALVTEGYLPPAPPKAAPTPAAGDSAEEVR